MLGNFKRQWRAFHGSRPGKRFEDRYTRSRKARKTQPWWMRFLEPFLALVFLAIAVVLTVFPGPAVIFYFGAAGLLAGESLRLARGLDWSEVKLRKLFHWCVRWWKRAPLPAKIAVIFVATCAAAGLCYLAWRIFLKK